jgi:hypothetical protein
MGGVSRNEDFDNSFWSQEVVEGLSADATLLYIWSWTNPHCGMAGLYELGVRPMTESNVAADRILDAFEELAVRNLAFYVKGVVFVRARVKRLRTKSPQIAKSIAKDVALVDPAHPLRVRWVETYRNTSWLRAALAEGRVNLRGTSGEPQGKLDAEPNVVSLARTSQEVPLSGTGQESRNTASQGVAESHLRAQIDEATQILSAVESWEPDEVGVANAAAMYPTIDLLQGCRLAATWASDPTWEVKSCAATLRAALRKLDEEGKPKAETAAQVEKRDRRKRRSAALGNLLASTDGPA